MEYDIRSIKAIVAPLMVALAVITSGASMAAEAAGQVDAKKVDDRRKIGEANDLKLRARDPLFTQQAKALAEQYRETAEIVARQGGNAQPLLDAAAHLEGQSQFISRAAQSKHLPVELPDAAATHLKRNK